jgi:glutaredoxin 3
MSLPKSASEILKTGVVTIISKSYCPFCQKSKALFHSLSVPYTAYEFDLEPYPAQLISELEQLSGLKSYSKNFVGEVSIGGWD